MKLRLSDYSDSYRDLVRLGLPILVGQLGMIVVGFADNIMVGRYSTDALAAASFVNNVFNVAMLGCIGFTYGLTPLAGALFGAGNLRQTGALTRLALKLNIVFTLAVTALMAIVYANLDRLGQPPHLLPLIRPYFVLYLCGMLPVAVFNVMAQWSYAINRTSLPMWIILVANALNIAGNYALIYGHWGAPEMGLAGAGASTLASRVVCPVLILAVFFISRRHKVYSDGFRRQAARRGDIGLLWRTSLPVSLQMTFETAAFSLSAVMVGWLGHIPLAAFQIFIIIGTLGFCVYYSLGSAIAVKVANAASLPDPLRQMRRVAWAGYHIMIVLMLAACVIFVVFGRTLMHAFTDDPAVLALAGTLIFPLVLYQLGDATQITFANALRGTSHVMPMLWIAFVSYLVVGVPSTWVLCFPAGLGTYGVILSFSVSLFLAAALFLIFFLRATRPCAAGPVLRRT